MAYIGNPPLDVRSFGSTKFEFTATAGQTAFTGTDDNNIPLAFVEDQIEVYVNGVLMDNSDFSSSGGNTVTLAAAAAVNDIVTVIAAKTNVPNVDYVAATGGTFTGNVNFGDNDRVRLGDGNDLELYHDSSNNHSFIRESGTGDLRILGDNISLRSTSTDEPYINIATNGAVTLYYDNAAKLATTSTGVDVTGTVTADGLTVDGSGTAQITSTSGTTLELIRSGSAGQISSLIMKDGGNAQNRINSSGGALEFEYGASNLNALKIANNGDISFYEDTGTTAKLFWDASAESLGIGAGDINLSGVGTGGFNTIITVQGNNQFRGILELANSTGVSSVGGSAGDVAWFDNDNKIAQISALGQDTTNHDDGDLAFYTASGGTVSERMRIDSNGKVGIGVTPESNWATAQKALQVGTTALVDNGSNDAFLGANYYYDGSNNKYINTGEAAALGLVNGEFQFFTASSGSADANISFSESMNISSGGQVRINSPGIGVGTSGAGLAVKAISTNSSPFTTKSASYDTVFSVLPWNAGRTYLSSGGFYEDGTWKAATHSAGMALLGFSGNDGLKLWAGDGSADDEYDTYASSRSVFTRYGVLNTRDKSFFTGNHQTQTSSTSWVTIGTSASGYTGSRVSGNLNIMQFTKLDNNSDLHINFNMPYYFSATDDSGFGIRLRYLAGTTGSYGTDVYANGPAHGWGAGGYGGDNQTGIVNYTWNTEKIISNTYVGEVRFYFETKVWSSTNTLYWNYSSTYPKFGYIHVKEVPRN